MDFRDLKFLQERQKRKCEKLEQVCREKESLYSIQIQSLQEQNKVDLIVLICLWNVKISIHCNAMANVQVKI